MSTLFVDAFAKTMHSHCGDYFKKSTDWRDIEWKAAEFLTETRDCVKVLVDAGSDTEAVDREVSDRLQTFSQQFINSYDFSDTMSNGSFRALIKETANREFKPDEVTAHSAH